MSVYSVKGKGWRYDFTQKGVRHTEAWFKTKKEAQRAEARKKEEIKNPTPIPETPTDIAFLELVNRRLDHVKAYNSERYYTDHMYMARRWVKKWGDLECSQITSRMTERFILERVQVSPYVANKDLRCLRALFNFGMKRNLVATSPLDGIDFLPVEKRIKYVPHQEDIEKVLSVADPDTRDYLSVIRETMGRMSEINRLQWDDVDLTNKTVTLYTRKKKGGHLTPRRVPMTKKLHAILSKRYTERNSSKPWVFWHRYWSKKSGCFQEGPYLDRKLIMRSLCKKADVKYFRFHALRHAGASVMDNNNVPIGAIQKILGHENRTTTEIYLHNMGDLERQAMEIFEIAR